MLKKFIFSLIIILLIILAIDNTIVKSDDNEVQTALNEYDITGTYNKVICKNILIIDKINLNKCMNINDVDKDLAILFDDKTVVIAGHSGTASNAYFKNLYRVSIGDEVIFYHNGEKATYIVREIDTKKKKDKLHFKNIDNQLILVTCSYIKNDEQLVYLLEKISKND